MASVTVIFRKEKLNKKGEAPIHLRIIKDRKINFITTGIMLPKKYWDERNRKIKIGYPNSRRLNSFIANKYAELQDQVFEHETVSKSLSTRQLKDKIYGKKPTDFIAFANEACQLYLNEGKIGTYDKNRSIIKKVAAFSKSSELTFQEITPAWLTKYEQFCRIKFGNKANTIHKDLKFIRKLFNDAIRQDIIEINQNPFTKYQLKVEKTQRSFLNENELKLIEDCKLTPGTRMDLHRDMFVFASYTGGLRVSDILQLQWKNFDGINILFTIKKTGQQISIKLPNKALDIIKKFTPEKLNFENFIFPMLAEGLDMNNPRLIDNEISSATAYINKNLKLIAKKVGIEKPLSFHISRHTWATRALRKGISIDKVSKLMGHAAIRETQIYAKIVNEELDKAMDVFNV